MRIALAWVFSPGNAVHDVGARLFQRARPADVLALVEARLELDQADRLLALLGGLDQRRDERRVVGGAVHGHLDRQHVGVVDGLLDEPLDAGGERLVGVVDEDVGGAHHREQVGLGIAVAGGRDQSRLGDRRPARPAQVGAVLDRGDLPQIAHVEQAVDVVDLDLVDVQPLDQPGAQRGVHAGADLEPDDLAEAPATELVLDRLQQVVGLVGDLEIGVAGDPEQVVADDLHAGEQGREVVGDDVLERDEGVLGDLHEPRQHLLRHLDPGERVMVGVRVVQPHDQAQRQVGDVRERPPGADRQRGQHREDLLPGSVARSRSAGAPSPRS